MGDPHRAAHVHAVEVRQTEVQEDQVRVTVGDQLEGLSAGAGHNSFMAVRHEGRADLVSDHWVVLDYQDNGHGERG